MGGSGGFWKCRYETREKLELLHFLQRFKGNRSIERKAKYYNPDAIASVSAFYAPAETVVISTFKA